MTAGRRLALSTVALQSAVIALLSLLFSAAGRIQAFAVLLGGMAIIVSSWSAARITFTARAQSAEGALLRLIAGLLFKWFVVIAVLLFGTFVLKLPPQYVLVGLAAGLLVQFLVALKR